MTVAHAQRLPAAKLRRGRISDVDALIALERRFFTPEHRISRRGFRRFVASPKSALIVAEIGGKLAGSALVLYRRRSKSARLYSIAVAPEFQRRGLARRLLRAAEKNARRRGCRLMRLEVREDDAGAIALYERSGYRAFGRRPGYYGGRIAALRFGKPLVTDLRRRSRVSTGPS